MASATFNFRDFDFVGEFMIFAELFSFLVGIEQAELNPLELELFEPNRTGHFL